MRRISPSMVVAVVALVFSCTGGAVAATLITGKQIKDGTIKGNDIASGTIGPSRLSNAVNDLLDEGKLPGPAGPAGPAGAAGAQGPAGPSDLSGITIVVSNKVPWGSDFAQSATALCPAGQKVVSGGGVSVSDEQLAASQATSDRSGWYVIGVDTSVGSGEYVQAQALCAASGKAVAASVGDRATRARAEVEARLAQVQSQVAAQRQ